MKKLMEKEKIKYNKNKKEDKTEITEIKYNNKTEEDKNTKEQLESDGGEDKNIENIDNGSDIFGNFGDYENDERKTEGYIETTKDNLDDIEGETILNNLEDMNNEFEDGKEKEKVKGV